MQATGESNSQYLRTISYMYDKKLHYNLIDMQNNNLV